ncbi:MAG: VTT domain-containing protein [Elusimicrobiota bacterium]|nr:VTT domain-containing protein [Elusimicrobiota bacterium]
MLNPFVLMRKTYEWTLSWGNTKYSSWVLFVISFIESSFFPIPPDVLLIPLTSAQPKKWFQKASICLIGSVLGAFLGYAVGFIFYETIGLAIVNLYHLQNAMQIIEAKYTQNAFLAIFTGAFTPIPYKAMTISAGIFHINIITLFCASLIGRGARFYAVAFGIRIFGDKIKNAIEKYFNALSVAFVILLIVGIAVLKRI